MHQHDPHTTPSKTIWSRRFWKAFYLMWVLGGVGCTIAWMVPWRLVYNFTNSLPVGWYVARRLNRPIERNDLVLAQAPQKAHDLGCIQGKTKLLKQVVGLPGERICLRERALWVPGRTTPYSTTPRLNSVGKPFDLAFKGCQVLGAKEYFLATPHPRSCDSRVLGPIKLNAIWGFMSPISDNN